MERIYIGGLNPPKLTAKEVASRLMDTVTGVQIHSADLLNSEKSFFYINATSTDNENKSALDLIAKQYNNVTWKQCKLVVQAARPHFLQRLQHERAERQRTTTAAVESATTTHQQQQQKIPRHLRIRQKYGQEAHPVDTKPCQTQEWEDFCRLVNKQRKRRLEYNSAIENKRSQYEPQEKALMAKKRAFRNRAVHLRWNESEPSLVEAASASTSSSQESDGDDSSEVSTAENTPTMNGTHSAYVWSDDESSSGDSGQESEQHEVANVVPRADASRSGGLSSEGSISSESDSLDDILSGPSKPQEQQNNGRYEWSNDESNDDDDLDNVPQSHRAASTLSLQPTSMKETIEFSAAIDFDNDACDDDSDDDGVDSNERTDVPTSSSQNLDEDVKANLSVLSSLFPDMAETKPIPMENGGVQDTRSTSLGPGWEEGPSSFGGQMSAGLGLMQRFDPTMESAKKYIIEQPKAALEEEKTVEPEESQNESESESESDDNELQESESASVSTKPDDGDSKTTVYEQSKLEDIFKHARSSGRSETFKMSSMFDSKIPKRGQPDDDKPFSFGFDLGGESTTTKQPKQQSGSFEFGFDVGSKQSEDGDRMDTGDAIDSRKPGNEQDVVEQASTGIRRRGLSFPEEVLDGYVNEFLNMNEGRRIREDAQGFLHDDNVKQQWKKERHMLTLDWKRKRKYAQSRMQKKMKFR